MKAKVFLFTISIFFAIQLFAQVNRNMPLQKKIVAPGTINQNIKKCLNARLRDLEFDENFNPIQQHIKNVKP